MPCTTNNTLQFKVTMIIEPDKPIKFQLQDLTNYAALGILQSTVRGNFVISDSNGTNIYRNDNFVSPNIIRANTDTVTVTSTVKDLDLTGVFYVCYKIQHVEDEETIEMCELKTYNVCFRPYTPSIFFVQDCYNAALRSEDTTNYTQVNAITTTEQAYVHTLKSTKAAAVNAVNKVATQKFPNLYNETYTATITSTYLYDFANNFSISYKATNSCTYTVDCNLDNCNITCCVECLRKRMNENYLVNPTLWEEYHEQFLLATALLALFEGQIRCGNLTAANDTAKQILEITDCNNGCQDCNCNDSNQIRPFMLGCQGEQVFVPCPPLYTNLAISETVYRQCPAGQFPVPFTYTLPAGDIYSMISQADAQAKAQFYFDNTKQARANAIGICIGASCGSQGNAPIGGVCCAGLIEEDGICVQPPTCGENGEAPIGGLCCLGLVNQSGICQPTCNAGFTPINGTCQPVPTCGNVGQAPIEGVCCAGLVNQSGICQTSCSVGFTSIDGVCVANPTCGSAGQAPVEGVCCAGLVNQSDICQATCDEGFEDIDGVCTPIVVCGNIPIAPAINYKVILEALPSSNSIAGSTFRVQFGGLDIVLGNTTDLLVETFMSSPIPTGDTVDFRIEDVHLLNPSQTQTDAALTTLKVEIPTLGIDYFILNGFSAEGLVDETIPVVIPCNQDDYLEIYVKYYRA